MHPVAAGLLGGALGWAVEAVCFPEPRYSKAFGGDHVPFLPVYAAGGAAIAAVSPYLENRSFLERAVVYGAGITALELGACALDRSLPGEPRWNYSPEGTHQNLLGCVDFKHSAAFTVMSLLFEKAVNPEARW
jgi:hypothetical protein